MLKIRPFAKGCDEEAFVRIFNATLGTYDDARGMTLKEMKTLEEAPSFSADGILLAEWDGETAGMVNAYVDKLGKQEKGFVQWLAVLPEFRRKGIARELVQGALKSLRHRGLKTAETWVNTDWEGCSHIFESFGFEPVRSSSMMKTELKDTQFDAQENNGIKLRELVLKDEKEIALLNWIENETFKEHFNYRPKPIEETRYLILESPWFKQRASLAMLDNQPVGFVAFGIDESLNSQKNLKYGWILGIGVLKPFRRKGIGTYLMLYSMQLLKNQGMEDAILYVDDKNQTGAMELYKKLRFSVKRKTVIYQMSLA